LLSDKVTLPNQDSAVAESAIDVSKQQVAR